LWIIGDIEPKTNKTNKTDKINRISGTYIIERDSNIKELELKEYKNIDANNRVSKERDDKEKDSIKIRLYRIKVKVLYFIQLAKFKYNLAWISKWYIY